MTNRKRSIGAYDTKDSFSKKKKVQVETSLDDDVIRFFLKAQAKSNQKFTDDINRKLFFDNALSMTAGHEVEYAKHRTLSFIIEKFLLQCSDSILLKYFEVFGEDLRTICCNPCTSNVLESLLKAASDRVFNSEGNLESNEESDDENVFLSFLLKVSRFLLNNLDEFLLDSCANHVTRTAMLCLSGYSAYNLKNTKHIKNNTDKMNGMLDFCLSGKIDKHCPKSFKYSLKQFADYMLNSSTIADHKTNSLVSGLLQSLLVALHTAKSKKLLNSMVDKLSNIYSLNEQSGDTESLKTEVASSLSVMIVVSSEGTYEEIYQNCFSGKVKDFALSSATYMCVQRLIDRCTDVEVFKNVYNELSGSFDQIVQSGNSGVLVSLSKASHRLRFNEQRFMKDIMNLLGCASDDKNCVFHCLLSLKKHEPENNDITEESIKSINYFGSLIVQECLKFDKPQKIMNSLLATDNKILIKLLCNKFGSRVADVIFGNEIKNETYKVQFKKKLKGSLAELATNVYGSFAVTSLWKTASFEEKLRVVEELVAKESLLTSNKYGVIISKIIDLQKYRVQPDIWKRHQKELSIANTITSKK